MNKTLIMGPGIDGGFWETVSFRHPNWHQYCMFRIGDVPTQELRVYEERRIVQHRTPEPGRL